MRVAMPLVLLLLVLPGCPSGAGDDPEAAVEGFLDALNEHDWDGMMARMTREARATLPEDPKLLIWKRAEVFALIDRAGGRILYEITGHEMVEDDRARVLADLVVDLPMGILRRSATFHVRIEDGEWKLLPEIEDQSGMVISNPLDFLTGEKKPVSGR